MILFNKNYITNSTLVIKPFCELVIKLTKGSNSVMFLRTPVISDLLKKKYFLLSLVYLWKPRFVIIVVFSLMVILNKNNGK